MPLSPLVTGPLPVSAEAAWARPKPTMTTPPVSPTAHNARRMNAFMVMLL
jgi:hypothetical protein